MTLCSCTRQIYIQQYIDPRSSTVDPGLTGSTGSTVGTQDPNGNENGNTEESSNDDIGIVCKIVTAVTFIMCMVLSFALQILE